MRVIDTSAPKRMVDVIVEAYFIVENALLGNLERDEALCGEHPGVPTARNGSAILWGMG